MNESDRARTEPDTRTGRRVRRNGLNRRHFLTTASGAASLSVAGCLETVGTIRGGNGNEEPIRIGALAPDPDSNFIGRGMARGAQVAVDDLNESGGILGRDVELVVGDTNSSPLEARRQYQRLILEEDVDVTTGVFASEVLVNLMDDIAEQETIHLTSGAATSQASKLVREQYDRYKYHFRVGPTNDHHLGESLVHFLDDNGSNMGWDSVAVLAEDYEWTEEPWNVFQEQLGGIDADVVMEERYPPATDDFSGIYDRAEAAGADTAFIATAHTGTSAMLDWSYPNRPERPPRPRPFAFGGIHVPMQFPSYYEATGGACRYGVSTISATAQSTIGDLTQSFVSSYRDTYDNTPVYTGYTTYEAVMLYAAVVEQTESRDSDDLVPALENVSFSGTTGTIEFYGRDETYPHDLVYDPGDQLYFQWQENDAGEGVQEIIWPEKHKTADYQTPIWLR